MASITCGNERENPRAESRGDRAKQFAVRCGARHGKRRGKTPCRENRALEHHPSCHPEGCVRGQADEWPRPVSRHPVGLPEGAGPRGLGEGCSGVIGRVGQHGPECIPSGGESLPTNPDRTGNGSQRDPPESSQNCPLRPVEFSIFGDGVPVNTRSRAPHFRAPNSPGNALQSLTRPRPSQAGREFDEFPRSAGMGRRVRGPPSQSAGA